MQHHVETQTNDSTMAKIRPATILESKDCPNCGQTINRIRYTNPMTLVENEMWAQTCNCAVLDEMRRVQQENAAANAKAREENAIQTLITNTLVSPDLKTATFSNYEPTDPKLLEAKKLIMAYVDEWREGNVILHGTPGVGKSHLGFSAMKKTIRNGKTALFISVPLLLTKIRSTFRKDSEVSSDDIITLCKDVDLLILDDIGIEASKEFAMEQLYIILDGRQGKRTMFTTNYSLEELYTIAKPAHASRMFGGARPIAMNGKDYRKTRTPNW